MTARAFMIRASVVACLVLASATIVAEQPAGATTAMVGTFTLTAGACSGGDVTGSYFRMILQGGNANGPFLSNSNSTCADQSYTPMTPGTDGGLVSGSYQPQPSPPFDGNGNSLANRIIAPADFYGVRYGASSQPVDPQTGTAVPAPAITLTGTALGGQVSAVSVSWNNQYFNQGSPKPDGTDPGDTTPLSGTYDPSTGAYTLHWTSQIVGGPFNGFSGLWVLTGKFLPAGSQPTSTSAGGGHSSSTSSVLGGSHAIHSAAVAAGTAATSTSTSAPTAVGLPDAPVSAAGHGVFAVRTTTRSGLDPPPGLVAAISVLGLLSVIALIYFDRRIRRARPK